MNISRTSTLFGSPTLTGLFAGALWLALLPASGALNAQSRPAALVVHRKGPVSLIRDGKKTTPSPNSLLARNDQVRVAAGGRLDLQLSGGTMVRIGPGSSLYIKSLLASGASLRLQKGDVTASVRDKSPYDLRIHTPTAIASVRGTDFIVESGPRGSTVFVGKGSVAVKRPGDGSTILVRAGFKVRALRGRVRALRRARQAAREKRRFEIIQRIRARRKKNFRALMQRLDKRRREIRDAVRRKREKARKRREEIKKRLKNRLKSP